MYLEDRSVDVGDKVGGVTGEDMADMVETDTITGGLRLYTSLNVAATRRLQAVWKLDGQREGSFGNGNAESKITSKRIHHIYLHCVRGPPRKGSRVRVLRKSAAA